MARAKMENGIHNVAREMEGLANFYPAVRQRPIKRMQGSWSNLVIVVFAIAPATFVACGVVGACGHDSARCRQLAAGVLQDLPMSVAV